jgi:quercetin dioxygenase-like cupin family protein
MNFIELENIKEVELIPGFRVRFLHSENMTTAYWSIDAGATLPDHTHVHEQVSTIIEGQFKMMIDGETRVLEPGVSAVIASNIEHGGTALTHCQIIDTFYPVREEYRQVGT